MRSHSIFATRDFIQFLLSLLCAATMVSHAAVAQESATETKKEMGITTSDFGKTADGEEIKLITCTNQNGLVLKMTNYGAIVVAMETPDRDGKMANITLGFDNLDSYLQGHPYFGSTVGRFCNRIAKGKFELNGKEYTLAVNNGENHLHGRHQGI